MRRGDFYLSPIFMSLLLGLVILGVALLPLTPSARAQTPAHDPATHDAGTFGPGSAVKEGDPLVISELDALRYDLLVAKVAKHRAELENLQLKVDQLQRDLKTAEGALQAERDALDAEWKHRYGVSLTETKREGSKFIRRKPDAPPPQ